MSLLKSVEDHNREKLAQRVMRLTGVACPQCGQELRYKEVFYMIGATTTRKAECLRGCGEILLET